MLKIYTLLLMHLIFVTILSANNIIKGSGASFPYTLYQQWIQAYYKESGVKIDYIKKGSSKGIQDAKLRMVDFAGTDKPLSPKFLRKNELYQFPSSVGAIVMGFNLPNVQALQLSREALVAIASGKIKYWDDALLLKENQKVKLPHKKLLFVHRADGSGTTYNFTYFLSKISQEWRDKYGAKKLLNWRGKQHIGGKANSGVTALLKQTPYSIGYIDYSAAKNNQIRMAEIENREGYFITPTFKSFHMATQNALLDPKKDFYSLAVDPIGRYSYPMIAVTFVLLLKEKEQINREIVAFYNWSFQNAQEITRKLGYVPLPNTLVNKIRAYWQLKALL